MNGLMRCLSCLVMLGLLAMTGCHRPEEPQAEQTSPEATTAKEQPMPADEAEATSDSLPSNPAEAQDHMNARLSAIKVQLQELKTRIERLSEQQREIWSARLSELERQIKEAETQVQKLRDAGKQEWMEDWHAAEAAEEKARAAIESALDELGS